MGLVEQEDEIRGLHDLPRERVDVELLIPERQAPHIRVVLAVVGHALLQQLLGPRPERQTVLESCADVAERRRRLLVEAHCLFGLLGVAGQVAIGARQIRLAVGHARRRSIQIDLAVGGSCRTRVLLVGPLGRDRGRDDDERADEREYANENVHEECTNRK